MSTPSLNQPDRPDPMADFPVQWADAAEEERTWLRDTVHFPTAITHMDFTLLVKSMEHGMKAQHCPSSLPKNLPPKPSGPSSRSRQLWANWVTAGNRSGCPRFKHI